MKYNFLEDIATQMREQMKEDISSEETSSCITYNTNDGYIDICTNHHDDVEVSVIHDNDSENECPLLEKTIQDIIPYWADVESEIEPYDEWNEHGFANEADYMRYRYG